MNRRKTLKESFLERGAAALKQYQDGETYRCPICGNPFDRTALTTGELTLEHSPPKAIGGKPIALTCRDCNSRSGHLFEANLSKREEITALMEIVNGNRRNERVRILLQVGEARLNTEVYQDDGGVRVLQTLKGNNPKSIDEIRKFFEQVSKEGSWDGQQIQITSHAQYSQRLADLALLKAAFIGAFAAFGYRYAFNSRLRCVREQILKPTETIIEGWNIQIEQAELPEFALLYVESIPGIIAKFRKSSVVLPWISGPSNLYEDLKSRYQRNERARITGIPVPWPRKLELWLDVQPSR